MKSGAAPHGSIVIVISFIVALMLTIVELPAWLREIRPFFVVSVLIYWCMALPQRVGVGTAWVMGLLLDVIHNVSLGQNAMALALVAFITIYFHQRLRVFPAWQQAITIFVFCLFYAMLILWLRGITGTAPNLWSLVIHAFMTALIWPPLFMFLRHVRRFYRVT